MAAQQRLETRRMPDGTEPFFHHLEDQAAGSRAMVSVSFGGNCLSWQVLHQGKVLELLWSDLATLTAFPARHGMPILFPFPNRIRDGQFSWQGRAYRLPPNDPRGTNAIHGFVLNRPWNILAVSEGTETGSFVTLSQDSGSLPREMQSLWPAGFDVELTWLLHGYSLELHIDVRNCADEDLPFGFGVHPYFRMPAAGASLRWIGESSISQWELRDCLPTGQRGLVTSRCHKLLTGKPLEGDSFDDAFRIENKADQGAWLVQSPEGWSIRASQGPGCDAFRDYLIFTPPHREAVCLEPYTCITDAINLQPQGIDAGLLVLPPGEAWEGWLRWEWLDAEATRLALPPGHDA
jgi:aldose 1-epimerase